jgi:hypothetical protein
LKKKLLFISMALILLLSLSVSMAVPAMAADYGIAVTISASATEVSEGDSVDLTITLENYGTVYLLESAYVALVPLGLTLTPNMYGWYSNTDGDNDLAVGEIWTWIVSTPPITELTWFCASGFGHLPGDGWISCQQQVSVSVGCGPCPPPPPPPPPPGDEGLTPGYWKNHLEMWPSPITPSTLLGDYVTIPGYTDISFFDALQIRGGDLKALVRHAAAAVLNAVHSNIDYPVDVAGIQAIIDDPGLTITESKNLLESYNELEGDINN